MKQVRSDEINETSRSCIIRAEISQKDLYKTGVPHAGKGESGHIVEDRMCYNWRSRNMAQPRIHCQNQSFRCQRWFATYAVHKSVALSLDLRRAWYALPLPTRSTFRIILCFECRPSATLFRKSRRPDLQVYDVQFCCLWIESEKAHTNLLRWLPTLYIPLDPSNPISGLNSPLPALRVSYFCAWSLLFWVLKILKAA